MSNDRNLRLAIRALGAGRITAEQLALVGREWEQTGVPLAVLLLRRGWVTAEELADLDRRSSRDPDEATTAPGVERLLVGLPSSNAFIGPQSTIDLNGSRPPEDETLPCLPERYQFVRLLAHGGMGRVWVVRDLHLNREVVLKEVRPDRADIPQAWRRLLNEARITGRLQHRGIVPVYDLIATAEGLYYTMRRVDGGTLSAAVRRFHEQKGTADAAQLRPLLEAFVEVCQTIAYAHEQQVVHRDLKGDNLLLGRFGEAFVIDWGLGRGTGDEGPPGGGGSLGLPWRPDEALTQQGQVVGTPGFMAPEQARGDSASVGPPCDIHGLGAVLYLILTGRPPFVGDSLAAVLKQTIDERPAPPRRFWPEVPGDLEAVCLKALSKDPAQRYPSAEALAKEVQSWLDDRPVLARREPWRTWLRRWAGRHSGLAAGVAALLLSLLVVLLVGVPLLHTEQQRARDNEERAAQSLLQALSSIDEALVGLSHGPLNSQPGTQPVRRQLAAAALDGLRQLDLLWGDRPEVRMRLARAWDSVGRFEQEMGDQGRAVELLERSCQLRRELIGQLPHPHRQRCLLARTLICKSGALRLQGKLADAHAAGEEARRLLTALQGDPETQGNVHLWSEIHYDLGGTLKTLAMLALEVNEDAPAATAHFRDAVTALETAVKATPDNADFRLLLASVCAAAGVYLRTTAPPAEALRWLERGRGLIEGLPEPRRSAPSTRQQEGNLYNALYLLQASLGKESEAEAALERALDVRGRLVRDNPEVVIYKGDLSSSLMNRGKRLAARGDCPGGLRDYREAARLLEQFLAVDASAGVFRDRLARVQREVARLSRQLGQLTVAAEAVRRWVELAPADGAAHFEAGREMALCAAARAETAGRYLDLSVGYLREALRLGFARQKALQGDFPVELLRSHPDGAALLAEARRKGW